MIELALNKIQKYYGATMVLEDITFEIQTSEKIGLVGANGCGKSTLLKIITGIEEYEKGMMAIRKGATLGYLEQMPVYPDNFKVIDVLNEAFKKVDSLQEELKKLERELSSGDEVAIEKKLNKYSELLATYESLGGYEKEEKLSKICNGLKITDSFKKKLFAQLSGGEKTTIIIGKILLQSPDILLLDEPSNHLDLEAIEWLEGYLKEYKGAVLIVSHDRYFLDKVVTKIVEIEDMIAKSYSGNYSAFVKEKEIQLQLQLEYYQNQQRKIETMEKTIKQLRDWGQRGDNSKFFRRAASMQKMLEKIQRVGKPVMERDKINMSVNTGGRSGNDVVIIKSLSKSYGEKVLLNNAELLVRNREAVALIGENGCGKSTLIKILLGIDTAEEGTAALGSFVKLGYLPQNITFNNEESTILECFREDIVITDGKAREYLAKYMFFGESVFKKVGTLSGGERSRLKLATLMYNEVNFLILDEPTNHLDIDSREELEELLKDFAGTLLFVSHDRFFINRLARRVVELKQGSLISYEGDYEYYKEKSSQLKSSTIIEKIADESKLKKCKKMTVSPVSQTTNSEFRKQKLEKQIEEYENSLKLLEEEINSFSQDYEKLNALYNERAEKQEAIDNLIEEYFSL